MYTGILVYTQGHSKMTIMFLQTANFQISLHILSMIIVLCWLEAKDFKESMQQTACTDQGPVVQSVVSLTSSLRVISLTVLADSIYNILIFFAEKM